MPASPNINISATPGLDRLLGFAARNSPYYSQFEWAERLRQGRSISFDDLQVTAKATVKANVESFFCPDIPDSEGKVRDLSTSGSTGEPMAIRKTGSAIDLNAHENNRLRVGWDLERHRLIMHCTPVSSRKSGEMEEELDKFGRTIWTIRTLDPVRIVDWFQRLRPTLLQGFPSTMQTVFESLKDLGNLTLVATVGEVVTDEFRTVMQRWPGCRHYDAYGCKEGGLIAAKCFTCNHYHIADRQMIVEILDDDGNPAPPGSRGRVVITPLFNLAMPLIRYEIGDYAVVSEGNACARSSQSLKTIIGRERNLFTLPNGTRITPHFPNSKTRALGLSKVKLIQLNLHDVEVRYIPVAPEMELSLEQAQNVINVILSPDMRAIPIRVESLPAAPSGKYLMHESLI
jgi:phenylacetate-CoA ligase